MTVDTKLLRRFEISTQVRCDVIQHRDGRVKAHIYPVYAATYWKTHSSLDLTERELREILEAVQEGKTS